MASSYISAREWLARLISRQARAAGAKVLLRSTIGDWVAARDLSAAIAHALQTGWLVDVNGELWLSPSGEEIGKRPRAAFSKRRRRRRRRVDDRGQGGLTIEGGHSVCSLTTAAIGDEEIMSDDMPVDLSPAEMFTLLDRKTVRLQLPALPVIRVAEPSRIHLDFDAASVDEMLGRLAVLRAQMLPSPSRN